MSQNRLYPQVKSLVEAGIDLSIRKGQIIIGSSSSQGGHTVSEASSRVVNQIMDLTVEIDMGEPPNSVFYRLMKEFGYDYRKSGMIWDWLEDQPPITQRGVLYALQTAHRQNKL